MSTENNPPGGSNILEDDVQAPQPVHKNVSQQPSRNRWAPIEQVITRGGETTKTHPFLDSVKDLKFVRQLLVETPFLSSHGWPTKSTTRLMKLVSAFSTLRSRPLPSKTGSKKSTPYMVFAKKYQNEQPFRSGCDDDDPPGEIQQGIESLYEMWQDFSNSNKGAKESLDREKKKGKAMAEALRRSALGEYIPKPKNGENDANYLLEIGFCAGDSDNDDNLTPAPRHSRGGSFSSIPCSFGRARNCITETAKEVPALWVCRVTVQ